MCEGSGVITALALTGIALAISSIVIGSLALSEVRDIPPFSVQSNGAASGPTPAPFTSTPNSTGTSLTMEAIIARNHLRCGVPDGQIGFAVQDGDNMVGFDADLCRAIAAAIFGESKGNIEFVPIASGTDRWSYLQDESVDVLANVATFTMERDVNEPSVGVGFEFTTPYLYNGVGFGGIPSYAECAENLNVTGSCSGLLICVSQGTTHVPIVRGLFPSANILPVAVPSDLYVNLISGNCNVIAEEQTGIAESVVRESGYKGDYETGKTQYSKEPLAVVTREGDAIWSDFVFWVVEALLGADERDIRQATASDFPETPYFGASYRKMFQHAIADVGNYGEMYDRHLESIVPRVNLNTINNGTSGLIYSFPFGSLLTIGPSPIPGGTIEAIRKRGHLKCGITTQPSFGDFDRTNRVWSGFDVDFCRALSAAIFDGVDTHVVYSVLPATDRFIALASGQVDCLSRVTTFTQERDRAEPTTGSGFSFGPVVFYDGLSFGGIPPYDSCADKLDAKSSTCKGLQICVQDGTTTIKTVSELFPESVIVAQPTNAEAVEALGVTCNAIGGDSADIAADSVLASGYNGTYKVGTTRHSKEPLAIVTREDDFQWTNFVRWITFATFYAEEQGITQATATEMPRCDLFGPLLRNIFIDAINAVGNYGEIYARNVEALVPRAGGLNALNQAPAGPQQYPAVF
jgi:general L-amino acid transport system substrate-binding protein